MSDYREELRVGKEILARVGRGLSQDPQHAAVSASSNLYDFDPAADRLPRDRLEEVDRYIAGALRERSAAQVLGRVRALRLPGTIFQTRQPVRDGRPERVLRRRSKDRLYTFAAASRERRSAQTAMYIMADGLARLLAPILSFTADELWRLSPGRARANRCTWRCFRRESWRRWSIPGSLARWEQADRACATRSLAQIEPLRKDKQIGSSLQAQGRPVGRRRRTSRSSSATRTTCRCCSSCRRSSCGPRRRRRAHDEAMPRSSIERADGVKCERCWRYVPTCRSEPAWAGSVRALSATRWPETRPHERRHHRADPARRRRRAGARRLGDLAAGCCSRAASIR